MRQKILAIGYEEFTARIRTVLAPRGIEVARLAVLPDSLGDLKKECFDLVVVDSTIPDIENTCFRTIWMVRLRTAVISPEPQNDKQLLGHLGIHHFIQAGGQPFDLVSDIEMMISLGSPEFESPNILVIEDDRHIREAIRLSFRIFWPESELFLTDEGQTGLNIFKSKAIDTVLLDLGLPDMSGFEVLSNIRSFSRTPVIILSAARDQNNVIRAINDGATEYLVKPFKQIELMPRIRKHIRQYATTR